MLRRLSLWLPSLLVACASCSAPEATDAQLGGASADGIDTKALFAQFGTPVGLAELIYAAVDRVAQSFGPALARVRADSPPMATLPESCGGETSWPPRIRCDNRTTKGGPWRDGEPEASAFCKRHGFSSCGKREDWEHGSYGWQRKLYCE
jgi:hypothetical protein